MIQIIQIDDQFLYPDDPHKTKQQWIPRSQIKSSFIRGDGPGDLIVKEWVLEKADLLENIRPHGSASGSSDNTYDEPLNNFGDDKRHSPYRGTGGQRRREYDEEDDDFPF
jgi:hypothetical protein